MYTLMRQAEDTKLAEIHLSGKDHKYNAFYYTTFQPCICFKLSFGYFFLQSLKEKELANEQSKLAELEEIKGRQEKEITKLTEELKSHKQESMKVC